MRMPPGYRQPGIVLRLIKALYGLRKSPQLWQRELSGALEKISFTRVPHEPCCFTCQGIIIFFYVDNIGFAFAKKNTVRAEEIMQ